MYTIAFRARWCGVTSSEVLMNHLDQDRREVVDDGLLAVWAESSPDIPGWLWIAHRASPGSAKVTSSAIASRVNLVRGMSRAAAKFVASRGMRNRMELRYTTRT